MSLYKLPQVRRLGDEVITTALQKSLVNIVAAKLLAGLPHITPAPSLSATMIPQTLPDVLLYFLLPALSSQPKFLLCFLFPALPDTVLLCHRLATLVLIYTQRILGQAPCPTL